MKVSICIATHNKPLLLRNTLESIVCQDPGFEWELIVVDDGSPDQETYNVCSDYTKVHYVRLGKHSYANPAPARNVAYRRARGEVVIAQSDDVIHYSPDCIKQLVEQLCVGYFVIARVVNVDGNGNTCCDPAGSGYGDRLNVYTGREKPRPLFFLGSLYRRDLYAVGGNDEEFTNPSGEDRWFGMCLTNGLGLKPLYSDDIVGHHQMHPHCAPSVIGLSQRLVKTKERQARATGIWQSSRGPWI